MRRLGDGWEQPPDLVPDDLHGQNNNNINNNNDYDDDDLHGHALREVPLRVLQVRVRRAPRQMFQREEMEICPVKKII